MAYIFAEIPEEGSMPMVGRITVTETHLVVNGEEHPLAGVKNVSIRKVRASKKEQVLGAICIGFGLLFTCIGVSRALAIDESFIGIPIAVFGLVVMAYAGDSMMKVREYHIDVDGPGMNLHVTLAANDSDTAETVDGLRKLIRESRYIIEDGAPGE